MEIKDIIKKRRLELGLTMAEVAKAVGVSEATISRWESGNISNMGRSRIAALSKVLNLSPAYLMGWEDEDDVTKKLNTLPVGDQGLVPVLGRVSAGNGCLAYQEILYYEPADAKYANKDYFYLVVNGDSMYPFINDGDLVLVKKQSSVDSDSVGVFIVDGEDGVVKKVEYDVDYIKLISFNPLYPPLEFRGSDVLRVQVIGKVIESKRKW